MIDIINLPSDRFEATELCDCKTKNFIYGKNGTGKSTIKDSIVEQYSNEFDLRVFTGFYSVVSENNKLNAISLGTENTSLQPEIDEARKEIEKISKEVNEPNKGYNTLSEKNKAENNVIILKKEINQFYRKSAKSLKDEHQDVVGNINYNYNDFYAGIEFAQSLSESEMLS